MPTQIYKNKKGERVPGVTTIISGNLGWNKQQLMYWAWNEGVCGRDYKKTASDAADAGTVAHAMVEADLKGVPFKADSIPQGTLFLAETAYLAWLEWKDIVSFKLLKSEHPLISEEYNYGGCLDIAAIKKTTSIVDIKTSNGIYADHLIQVAAYGNLWNENYPDDPVRAYYILRLGKEDGSFHYNYWPSLPKAWDAFKHLAELHALQKDLKKLT